jgi:hypothetical protein
MSVLASSQAFRAILAEFDASLYSGDDCAALVSELARTEKACAAVRTLAAKRAADCQAHRGQGFRNPADWLSRQLGSTPGAARNALEHADAIDDCTVVREAVLAGELSLEQAGEIVDTEREVPGSADELVELAKRESLPVLRETARNKRLEAIDVDQLQAKQRAARSLRRWNDDLGMRCGTYKLPPAEGIAFENRLDTEAARIHRAARANGSTDTFEQHAADALIALTQNGGTMTSGTSTSRRNVDLVVVINGDDDTAHIIDGGPIPTTTAWTYLRDAFIKIVRVKGKKIDTIAHVGRYRPAELQTALDLGPDLQGVRCSQCGKRYGLQWDHQDPVAHGGLTTITNLDPKCCTCHLDKTETDRAAGLLNGPDPP